MSVVIACNIGSYRQFRESAYEHLERIGLRHVEVPVPPASGVDEVMERLAAHRLQPSTVMVPGGLDAENGVERFATDLSTASRMGVQRVFTSVKKGQVSSELIYERLRCVGEAARDLGIVVCLETHPDLADNGRVALETMRGVDHSHIRINFDTANIYYYNREVTATGELEKIADWVGAVHLKDTNGGYRTWNFPTLGQGVVDFPAVFSLLAARGFDGPCAMELEGIEGEDLDMAGVHRRVEDSLNYLRSIGAAD